MRGWARAKERDTIAISDHKLEMKRLLSSPSPFPPLDDDEESSLGSEGGDDDVTARPETLVRFRRDQKERPEKISVFAAAYLTSKGVGSSNNADIGRSRSKQSPFFRPSAPSFPLRLPSTIKANETCRSCRAGWRGTLSGGSFPHPRYQWPSPVKGKRRRRTRSNTLCSLARLRDMERRMRGKLKELSFFPQPLPVCALPRGNTRKRAFRNRHISDAQVDGYRNKIWKRTALSPGRREGEGRRNHLYRGGAFSLS